MCCSNRPAIRSGRDRSATGCRESSALSEGRTQHSERVLGVQTGTSHHQLEMGPALLHLDDRPADKLWFEGKDRRRDRDRPRWQQPGAGQLDRRVHDQMLDREVVEKRLRLPFEVGDELVDNAPSTQISSAREPPELFVKPFRPQVLKARIGADQFVSILPLRPLVFVQRVAPERR